jgi:hypothetical protein
MAGRSDAAEQWRPPRLFPSFSKIACLAPNFSKQSFWQLYGISMGYKASKRALMLSNFSPPAALFGRILVARDCIPFSAPQGCERVRRFA